MIGSVSRLVLNQINAIGGYNERKNIDIVKMIIKILRRKTHDNKINSSLIKFVKDRPGHDFRYAISSKKIRRKLHWKPSCDFDHNLRYTIDWYIRNKSWWTGSPKT